MRGHEPLIDMRRNRVVPVDGVFIDTRPSDGYWPRNWAKSNLSTAFIDIDPAESVPDMRVVINLRTDIVGDNVPRLRAVARAVVDAGASFVSVGLMETGKEEPRMELLALGNEDVKSWLEL